MRVPTMHLNGTSAQVLVDDAAAAVGDAERLLRQLYRIAPHGRDFYPQGPQALKEAAEEHRTLIEKVEMILAELREYRFALVSQMNGKKVST